MPARSVSSAGAQTASRDGMVFVIGAESGIHGLSSRSDNLYSRFCIDRPQPSAVTLKSTRARRAQETVVNCVRLPCSPGQALGAKVSALASNRRSDGNCRIHDMLVEAVCDVGIVRGPLAPEREIDVGMTIGVLSSLVGLVRVRNAEMSSGRRLFNTLA